MSELRPASPLQRPETARPRQDALPEIEPPTAAELNAIQRHLVALPEWEGGTVSEDSALQVTLVRGPGSGPDVSYAAMPRWHVSDWPARLLAVRERMQADGVWPSLLWCDRLDRPRGLDRELQRQGWVKVISETVLWVGHASVVPHLDPRLRIEAVLPRSLAAHQAIEGRIFGLGSTEPERRRASLSAAMGSGRLRAWIVWLDDEPLAVARLSQGDGVAALQGVGVLEGRRRQGFGSLITTIATRAGMAVGNRIVWLSVREDNAAALGVYERLGFRRAFSWARWLVMEDPRPRSR